MLHFARRLSIFLHERDGAHPFPRDRRRHTRHDGPSGLSPDAIATAMVKLVALYKKPPDPEEFDRHYFTLHTPLLRNYPGLRRLEITRINGNPLGETHYYLMAEMYFDSAEAVDRAMASPEGKAVAKDLMSFAAPFTTVFLGEVSE